MAATRKPSTSVASKTPADDTAIRILKKATCSTISGKSELTYNVGRDRDDALHIRVTENSGGGHLNPDWIALADILRLVKPGTPVTAAVLVPLYRRRSANSPGFLAAVLKAEGLLLPVDGKQRVHQLGDVAAFQARVKKLTGSGANLSDDPAKPKAPRKPKANLAKRKPGRKPASKKK